ncbi:hypothetical protein TNIN_413831, partial [Trichonephila inaurata madagascariensis]
MAVTPYGERPIPFCILRLYVPFKHGSVGFGVVWLQSG